VTSREQARIERAVEALRPLLSRLSFPMLLLLSHRFPCISCERLNVRLEKVLSLFLLKGLQGNGHAP